MTKKAPTWKMRDGTVIKVSEMEISHVQNTVAMLKRKGLLDPSRRDIKAMLRRLKTYEEEQEKERREAAANISPEEYHDRLMQDLEREDDGILRADWC